jgi:hypothetical protein
MKSIASLVVGCLLVTCALAAQPPSPKRMRAATELLQVMGAQRAAQASSEATVDNLIEAQPMMAPYRSVITAWAAKYVSWQELEPQMAALYANAFTSSELQDLIRFYESPTGRKAAAVMPGLARHAILIGSDLARQHIPELQQMIRARAAELQKSSPAH